MTALALPNAPLGEVCPVCSLTILDRTNLDTFRGYVCCLYCGADLRSHDAEHARRNVQQMTRLTLTMTPREP